MAKSLTLPEIKEKLLEERKKRDDLKARLSKQEKVVKDLEEMELSVKKDASYQWEQEYLVQLEAAGGTRKELEEMIEKLISEKQAAAQQQATKQHVTELLEKLPE